VKLNIPAEVGVPAKSPVDASCIPGGKEPCVIAKLYGALPPLAAN
jgi:hypothetical protein